MLKNAFILILGIFTGLSAAYLLIQKDVDTLFLQPDAVLPDGAVYYGDIVDGEFHGQGRLIAENIYRYEGGFIAGRFSGQGEILFENGSSYKGEFNNGHMSGTGILKYASGDVYKGEFALGFENGHGIYTTSKKTIYTGNFVKGAFTGLGSYSDPAGNKYTGEFLKWQRHGVGKFESENGDIYEGDFIHGEFTGTGKYTDPDKYISKGNFENWELHGQGSSTTEDGTYTGTFENGILNGSGEFEGKDGSVYKGQFENWYYHGKGTLVDEDGNTYKGHFEYGLKHGKGKMEYSAPDAVEKIKQGEWKYGNFKDPNEIKRKQELENKIETALYNQNSLLDSSLNSVKPGEPGKIEMFFLGVAAYGGQDVFLKETQYIKSGFDERFNTQNRSTILTNNIETMSDIALLTKTSLRITLNNIAEKMNRDEDILFLYITSHGSENHKLSIQHDGVKLPDISASELSTLINNLPVKWKIITISACYSGGYLDSLKNDNTLIMTAASKTRTSFGCSDDSEMTYFAKAYFKESLPDSDSFQLAFEKAASLIEEWEDEDIEENPDTKHSDPQIYLGKNIEKQLDQWWPK